MGYIGACLEEGNLMLVAEYPAKGNLATLLYTKKKPITFKVRLKLAVVLYYSPSLSKIPNGVNSLLFTVPLEIGWGDAMVAWKEPT